MGSLRDLLPQPRHALIEARQQPPHRALGDVEHAGDLQVGQQIDSAQHRSLELIGFEGDPDGESKGT